VQNAEQAHFTGLIIQNLADYLSKQRPALADFVASDLNTNKYFDAHELIELI
jgi:hypothetical protein